MRDKAAFVWRRMGIVGCAVLVLTAVATMRGAAQDTAPTFRSAVDLVSVDVVVTDASGATIGGLTADDFEVVEEGQRRPIATFREVSIPIDPAVTPEVAWVDADVQTNVQAADRTYVFALDEIWPDNALRLRTFVRSFLERFFGPRDQGAVVLVGRGYRAAGQPFTSSKARLMEALERFDGGFVQGGADAALSGCTSNAAFRTGLPEPAINTREFQVRQRLASLRALTEALAAVAGRKSVLYFTQCIGFDMFDVADYRGGVLGLAAEDAHAAMAAATRAGITFYPIDPAGLDGGRRVPGAQQERMNFSALAEVTGGFALTDSNAFMRAFSRVQAEASRYYALGFESAYTKQNGRFVDVDVRVRRPGLKVSARDGYLAALRGRTSPGASESIPIQAALASPLPSPGIGLRVFAAPFGGESSRAAVALVAEIDVETLELTEVANRVSGELTIAYTALDADDRAFPGGLHTFPLSLTRAAFDQVRRDGLRFTSTLALPPGQYQLRVAAATTSRAGSVVYDVDVPSFTAAPLTLSAVALGTPSAEGIVLRAPDGDAASAAIACRPPVCVVPLSSVAPSPERPLGDLPVYANGASDL